MINPADALRQQEAALALAKAEHEAPLLDEAADALAAIAPLTARLDAVRPLLTTPFVSIHLEALAADLTRAVKAVAHARSLNAADLEG